MVWKPIKCILRPTALLTNKKGPFYLHCVTLYCFNDVNLTIHAIGDVENSEIAPLKLFQQVITDRGTNTHVDDRQGELKVLIHM